MSDYSLIRQQLCDGNAGEVGRLVRAALGEGRPASEILDAGLLAGMDRVAEDYRCHVRQVPAVLAAARALHVGVTAVLPPSDARAHSATAGGPRWHVRVDPYWRVITLCRIEEPVGAGRRVEIALLLPTGRTSRLARQA